MLRSREYFFMIGGSDLCDRSETIHPIVAQALGNHYANIMFFPSTPFVNLCVHSDLRVFLFITPFVVFYLFSPRFESIYFSNETNTKTAYHSPPIFQRSSLVKKAPYAFPKSSAPKALGSSSASSASCLT